MPPADNPSAFTPANDPTLGPLSPIDAAKLVAPEVMPAAPLPTSTLPTSSAEPPTTLPPGAATIATRGAAWMKKILTVVSAAEEDLEHFVPKPAVASVEAEVEAIIKDLF